MFCPNCGAQNRTGVSHCVDCHRVLPNATSTPTPAAAPTEPPRILRRPGPLAPPVSELPGARSPLPPLPAPNISAPPGPMPSPFADATIPVPPVSALASAAPLPAPAQPVALPIALPRTPSMSAAHVQVAPTLPENTLPSLPKPAPPRPSTSPTPSASLPPTLTAPSAPPTQPPRAIPPVAAPPAAPQLFQDATVPLAPVPALPALAPAPPPAPPAPVVAAPAVVAPPVPQAPASPAAAATRPPLAVPASTQATPGPAAPAPTRSPTVPAPAKPRASGTQATGPAVAKHARELEVAGFFRHSVASVIDFALCGALVFGGLRAGLAALSIKATAQGVVDVLHATPLRLVPLALVATVMLFVWHLVPVALKGTPGQRALRLRLVDKRGAPPGIARLLVRAVVGAASALCFMAGPLWGVLVDDKRRTLADVVAGTVVIRA